MLQYLNSVVRQFQASEAESAEPVRKVSEHVTVDIKRLLLIDRAQATHKRSTKKRGVLDP